VRGLVGVGAVLDQQPCNLRQRTVLGLEKPTQGSVLVDGFPLQYKAKALKAYRRRVQLVLQDPTGAGDTFAGGFLGYLAAAGNMEGATLKRAALAGTVMASFSVQSFGTERVQALTEADYQGRIRAFEDMIRLV